MIYFAYGSNMDPEQMQSRCPGHRVLGAAKLLHYTLAFTRWSRAWNSGTADILPEQNRYVLGALYALTPDDLKRMDKIADYPNSYIRQDVTVQHGTVALPAMTYVAVRMGVFLPSKSYLERMIHGAKRLGFDPAYLADLQAIRTHPT